MKELTIKVLVVVVAAMVIFTTGLAFYYTTLPQSVGALILTGVATIGIAWYLIRHFVTLPLNRLREYCIKVLNADATFPPKESFGADLNELATTVSAIASRLKDRLAVFNGIFLMLYLNLALRWARTVFLPTPPCGDAVAVPSIRTCRGLPPHEIRAMPGIPKSRTRYFQVRL